MSKKMPRRAKKLPDHVKPGEIVLATYKGSVPWPSLIKNVYKAKAKATFNYLPLAPKPKTFKAEPKAFSPFDNKIPANAESDLKDAYEAAFDIINGIGQNSVPKTDATASVEEPTTSHASAMQDDASSSSWIQGKMLASAVMPDAPDPADEDHVHQQENVDGSADQLTSIVATQPCEQKQSTSGSSSAPTTDVTRAGAASAIVSTPRIRKPGMAGKQALSAKASVDEGEAMQVDSPSSSTGPRFRQQSHVSGSAEGDTPAAVAFSVRTPARQTPQQLPTPTTTRKRGTAAGMHPPGTDVHPPLKRQRRNKKDSQPAKVEDMHDEPPVLALVTEADNEVVVNDAQSKKDQNAPSTVGFTKVQVQMQSPGNLRNTSTPRSGSSKPQKTASVRQAEDLPAAISPLVSTPPPAEKSVGQPASWKKSAAVKLSSKTGIARERKSQLSGTSTSTSKAEVNVSETRKSKPESDQQATSSVRRGATRARVRVLSGTPVTKKKMDVPEELCAEEQLNVDHPDQEHCMIPRGARVFGQYAQAFYPAIICSDDGLSRYTIYFIEDGITKPVPNDSAFLLSKLVPGVTTMISPSPDDLSPYSIGREIEVVALPDSKNADEWKEGKFKVRDTGTGEEIAVLWTQFYFRKQDADALKPKQKAMPLVKESNIVLESRTSHRSRAAFNHSVAELPKALRTTIPLARGGSRPSTGKKEDLDKTQLASTSRDILNETPVNEEKLDELIGSTVADSTSGTEAGEKNAVTDIENVAVITASAQSLDQHEDEKASYSEKKPEDSVPTTSHLSRKDALESTAASQEGAPNHEEATLLNFIGYLLPAGKVIAPDGIHREFESQPFDSTLMAGKKVRIDWKDGSKPSDVDFAEQWSPIIADLGAEVVRDEQAPSADDELRQWFEVGSVDSPLEDNSCDPAVMTASGSEDVDVSDSDSLVEALITGRCPVAIPSHRVFKNWKFVVSCSTCHTGQPRFGKGDIRGLIELSGGTVCDKIQDFGPEIGFLIADTFSRTRKYIMALSLSIQCIHVNWIKESIEQGRILDETKYELPAGRAVGPDGQLQEFAWKPLKGKLMKGKKIWIYTSENTELPNEDCVSFWSSIVANLGAEVVRDEKVPEGESELAEWITAAGIDIVLTDPYCEWEILQAAETRASATVVGTEWVIEAIITEKCPDPRSGRYRHDAMPMP